MVALIVLPVVAPAAPAPIPTVTPAAVKRAERAKAVVFLDGVAAAYRQLHSLSATWKRTGYDPAEGTLAWLHSKPAQVRFENKADHSLFVSNGRRNHSTVGKETTGTAIDRLWAADKNESYLNNIFCDELTSYFLRGQNPLRTQRWRLDPTAPTQGQARLLGVASVNGARCQGVEMTEFIEGRDDSSTDIVTLWFDSHHLMRRLQQGTVEYGPGYVVDFQVHPNIKLSPSLFLIPNRPDGDT